MMFCFPIVYFISFQQQNSQKQEIIVRHQNWSINQYINVNLVINVCYHLLYLRCYRMSTEILRPTRSISYNDIKKRRMLRQSKSKHKLKSSNASTSIVHTEKKGHMLLPADRYAHERPNQKYQIFNVMKEREQNLNDKKETVKRVPPTDHYTNFTDRIQYQKTALAAPQALHDNQELGCRNSREILNNLIEQSKSQRKLLMYKQLRNKFKLSKSRERSRSAKSLIEKSKLLAKKLIDVDYTPQKPNPINLNNIKNANIAHRIKRFESVKEEPNNKHNFRYLVSAPRESENNNKILDLFKGSKKKKSLKAEESSISIQKQSSMFDSQDDKFLQEMCLKSNKKKENIVSEIKNKNQPKLSPKPIKNQKSKRKQSNEVQSCQNILALLDVEQEELSKVFHKKQRQKKILHDLQKLNKKFPAGFFKL